MVHTEHTWSVLVAAHALTASFSLVLGGANILRRRKGDPPHRAIGYTWVVLMYFTALSSYLLQSISPGNFSWIHILSTLTLVTLTLGLWNARRGDVRNHAGMMIGTYIGLWGAFIGVVAVPERLVPEAFQANWWGMSALTAAIVGTGIALVLLAVRLLGTRPEPAPADV
ncbi:DUF2306 domain-containing protein [Isoptericola croceus]|uniref:DUF2306 domain-containing protein n=1 Tax=Isoptericola croceus TaxID=3031406 RepID=UPI0023F7E296|nr:DUF2306 domain-containing protein [Isoptericola croceus]